MTVHPQFVRKNGRNEFVILPFEEFKALQERLEDLEDLALLRTAMRQDDLAAPSLSLKEVRAELGLKGTRASPARSRRARPKGRHRAVRT